ncbi:MAG: ATP-binding protein [Lysobacteraceae bacterium]|nr:MAG: ATP-binding protein [Xanthomonadaceae bacterium]
MHAADDAVTRAVGEIATFLEVADRSRAAPALEFSPLDFAEVIEEAVADCRQVTGQHRFVVVKEEAALVGLGERGLLLHAFDNILRNAIKYSPHGGTITVSLHVEAGQNLRWAVIAVRDEGIGVPAAALPFVFNRFYRAENVADIPGTGLGLSGTLKIAEAHHGAIGVESVEGQGCVITVRLPLELMQPSK